jgi:hypothetical protein
MKIINIYNTFIFLNFGLYNTISFIIPVIQLLKHNKLQAVLTDYDENDGLKNGTNISRLIKFRTGKTTNTDFNEKEDIETDLEALELFQKNILKKKELDDLYLKSFDGILDNMDVIRNTTVEVSVALLQNFFTKEEISDLKKIYRTELYYDISPTIQFKEVKNKERLKNILQNSRYKTKENISMLKYLQYTSTMLHYCIINPTNGETEILYYIIGIKSYDRYHILGISRNNDMDFNNINFLMIKPKFETYIQILMKLKVNFDSIKSSPIYWKYIKEI